MSVALAEKTAVGVEAYTPEQLRDQIEAAQQHPCVNQFHALWYQAKHTWSMTRYKGVPILKCPFDLQIYHDIIWQRRPALIVETGTLYGGSALWFADQLDAIGGNGRVVSIDVRDRRDPEACVNDDNKWHEVHHDRITWIVGSSTSPETVAHVDTLVRHADGPVMVSLDSDHHAAHVANELAIYHQFVTPDSYLVVEDTNISGRPITADDPGPGAAQAAFCEAHPNFIPNALCERYLLSMHPRGWLYRTT